jgi:hypothetical protein
MLSEVTPGLQQLIREAHPRLPFGALWYTGTCAINGAIGHAEHRSRSHDAVIRVYVGVPPFPTISPRSGQK